MKPSSKDDTAFLGTINLVLILVLLGAIAYFAIWLLGVIEDAGSFENFLSDIGGNLGSGLAGGIWGAASGFTSYFWDKGTSIGKKWNPVTTWRNSSNRDDGKWWTFW